MFIHAGKAFISTSIKKKIFAKNVIMKNVLHVIKMKNVWLAMKCSYYFRGTVYLIVQTVHFQMDKPVCSVMKTVENVWDLKVSNVFHVLRIIIWIWMVPVCKFVEY